MAFATGVVMVSVLATLGQAADARHGVLRTGSPPSTAPCRICGSNVIRNPGAEAGGAATVAQSPRVPDWVGSGAFAAMGYRAPGGQLSPASPGPRARGSNYFFGGPDANVSTGTQLVSLLAGAAGIQGTVYATLSGWLGGYATRLVVSFSGRGGRLLRMIWIGPVKAKSGAPVGGLRYRVLGATVPVGATEATIRLVMTRAAAGRGSEAADDLSLFLYQPGGGSG